MLKHIDKLQTAICLGVLFLGIVIGGHIVTHIMFGLLMFLGLVGLIENIPAIKWLVYKSNKFWDIMLFIASIIATVKLGVTITGAITVASIIYTFIYAPFIRNKMRYDNFVKEERKRKNMLSEIDSGSDTRYRHL